MKKLSKEEMKNVMGGVRPPGGEGNRVACMDCGVDGLLCYAAEAGGICRYEETYNGIYCVGPDTPPELHYCSDVFPN